MNGHKARVYVVQFHPRDQNIFLSGGWDDTVQVRKLFCTYLLKIIINILI